MARRMATPPRRAETRLSVPRDAMAGLVPAMQVPEVHQFAVHVFLVHVFAAWVFAVHGPVPGKVMKGLAQAPRDVGYPYPAQPSISPLRNRSQARSCATSIYSSGLCAWSIEPGPQMMVGTPCAWKWPPSVP